MIVSGVLYRGNESELLYRLMDGRFTNVSSDDSSDGLGRVLERPKFGLERTGGVAIFFLCGIRRDSGVNLSVTIKTLDRQGRLVLPKEWRDMHGGGRVVLEMEADRITITPLDEVDLAEYFDSIEVDLDADLSDWRAVRRELWERSG